MKSKILLVEDDPSLGFVIKDNLLIKGYDVKLCSDGGAADTAAARPLTRSFSAASDDMFPVEAAGPDGYLST